MKTTNYKGWAVQIGIGNPDRLPQEYHRNIYADRDAKIIYGGDILNGDWDEYNTPDPCIARVCNNHPYYGKPKYITRDELIRIAETMTIQKQEAYNRF